MNFQVPAELEFRVRSARIVLSALLPIFVIILCTAACKREPKSYEDCIIMTIKEEMNEAAVVAVREACAMKFADKSPPEESASVEPKELALLDGRGGVSYGNHFSGTMYNGLPDRTLTELDVGIRTTTNGIEVSQTYTVNVTIQPRSAGEFEFDVVVGDNGGIDDWEILGAKAVK